MIWAPGDDVAVLAALTLHLTSEKSGRRGSQDYMALPSYCSAARWRVLLDKDSDMAIKRQIVIDLASSLHCACPSERTVKFFVSF